MAARRSASRHTPGSPALTMRRVEPEGWVFRDEASIEDAVEGLLGFVQRDGSGFDAVWISPTTASERFDTFEQAVRAAEARCGARLSGGPPPPSGL